MKTNAIVKAKHILIHFIFFVLIVFLLPFLLAI